MKTKLSFLLSLVFVMFLSFQSFSQLSGIGTVIDVSGNQTRMTVRTGEIVPDEAIVKPYLNENYRTGVVTFVDESTKEGAFRYKVDEEVLEFQGETEKYVWNNIVKFNWLNPETGEIEYYENLIKLWPKSEFGGLARKLSDKVISKAFMDYVAPTRDPRMDVGDPNSYIVVSEYYFAILDNELVEFPKSKGDFFKIFGEHEKEVKKQASKAKLKHNEDEGVVGIVDIYESILNN